MIVSNKNFNLILVSNFEKKLDEENQKVNKCLNYFQE